MSTSLLTRRRLVLAAALCVAAAPSFAAVQNPRAMLESFLDSVNSASGEFRQTSLDRTGRATSTSTGKFAFRRPNRFVWEYLTPWRQQIVSNGSTIWLYDEDLLQVTVKRADDAFASTPAAVLFGQGKIDGSWQILEDERSVTLIPNAPQGGFESVEIEFDAAATPMLMKFVDSFGQTTKIEFTIFNKNVVLEDKDFEFQIPKGADILKEQ